MQQAQALSFAQTTIGKKAIMAVSGFILFGFVVVHMLGNFQLWLPNGPEAMHEYAVALRSTPGLIWVARIVLLAAVGLHIWAAVSLTSRNADARSVDYRHKRRDQATNYAARTMMWGGAIVAMYIVYHIMHLTLGYGPRYNPQNVYNNVVYGFLDWRISAFYIIANILLGIHLFHGAWSWFQSLGFNHPRFNAWRRHFATALAAAITIGNVAIPVTVMTGLIEPTTESFCSPELGPCDGFESND